MDQTGGATLVAEACITRELKDSGKIFSLGAHICFTTYFIKWNNVECLTLATKFTCLPYTMCISNESTKNFNCLQKGITGPQFQPNMGSPHYSYGFQDVQNIPIGVYMTSGMIRSIYNYFNFNQ